MKDTQYYLVEAAKYIGCSESKLRALISEEKSPKYYKVGNVYVFRESMLKEWIKQQEI